MTFKMEMNTKANTIPLDKMFVIDVLFVVLAFVSLVVVVVVVAVIAVALKWDN